MRYTKEEFAALLNGGQYPFELTEEQKRDAFDSGLVIVYGASDDLMELEGSLNDECGASDDGETPIYLTRNGFPESKCGEGDDCPYFQKTLEGLSTITPIWDKGGYSWTYETDIPHATFDVLEGDEKYCRGIVFNLADIKVG